MSKNTGRVLFVSLFSIRMVSQSSLCRNQCDGGSCNSSPLHSIRRLATTYRPMNEDADNDMLKAVQALQDKQDFKNTGGEDLAYR